MDGWARVHSSPELVSMRQTVNLLASLGPDPRVRKKPGAEQAGAASRYVTLYPRVLDVYLPGAPFRPDIHHRRSGLNLSRGV